MKTFLRVCLLFISVFIFLFILNVVTLIIPNVRMFTEWGIVFQGPIWIFVFWLSKKLIFKIIPKKVMDPPKTIEGEIKRHNPTI